MKKRLINEEVRRMQELAGIEPVGEARPRPSTVRGEEATRQLAKKLDQLGIPYKEDLEYAKKMSGEEELMLKLINPKTRKPFYAAFDSEGITIDGPGSEPGVDIIDVSVEDAADYLRGMYQNVKGIKGNDVDLYPGNMGDEMSAPTSMEEAKSSIDTVLEPYKRDLLKLFM